MRDPNAWVDPMGLMRWDRTAYYTNISAGAGVHYSLRSQCVNSRRGVADLYALGGGKKLRNLATLGARGVDVTFFRSIQ